MSFNLTDSKQIKLIPMECTDRENSDTVRSAVCAMLKPDCNMFTKGQIINSLMLLLCMNEKEASKALGLSIDSIKRKRLLLCFSDKEKKLMLDANFPEMAAALLAKLPPVTRHFAVRHCAKKHLTLSQTKQYIEHITQNRPSFKLSGANKVKSKQMKFGFVKDMGIILNSIERAINTAKDSGFDVKYEKSQTESALNISLVLAHKPFESR